MVRKYQYDDSYIIMDGEHSFLEFDDIEDEEAYARAIAYGRNK